MEKVGKNGVITVDESKTSEDELTISQGLEFDKGYLSPYMVSDQEKMVAELEDAYVLLTDMKISNINDIVPLLQSIVDSHKPLLIIADDLDGDVTSTLVVNKLRGTFNVVAVKAPEFGDAQKAALQDIAILTGAKFYSKDLGMKSRFILLGLLPAFCFKACSAVANSPYVARNTIWSDETGDFWFQYEGPNCDWAYGSYAHEGSRYAAMAKIASAPKRAYLWFESNGSLQGFFNFHTNDAKADSFTLSAGWTNEGDTYPMDPSPLTGLKMTSRALKSEEIDAKYYLMCLWTRGTTDARRRCD